MESCHTETIIAQCTPRGSGALALLRLSGSPALTVATQISKLASGKQLSDLPTHTIHYGWVVDKDNNHLDQVLFLLMHAPQTFTGQDTVEITCHNNQFIIEAIIQQAIAHGARLAQEGEFTHRAVLNDKIDLLQAEAINELIHANTQMALKKSLAQVQGNLSYWITAIEKELVRALSFSEASFEFIDDETITFGGQIKEIVTTILKKIVSLKKTFDQQQQIRQGIRVAIIGSVNVGKSSLFNALLCKERAIVTPIAGTTRDVIEAGLYKNGNYWTLIDTAGLRQTDNAIEKEGIKRSHDEAQQADIMLLVYDRTQTMTTDEIKVYQQFIKKYPNKIIVIGNKIDIPAQQYTLDCSLATIDVSSKNHINIELAEHAIQEKINTLFANIESPYLLNQRQFNILLDLEKKLLELKSLLNDDIQYELVSYHLNNALVYITELTGKSISEQAMDAVFREFCIGK